VPRVWDLLRGLAEYEKLTGILTGDARLLHEALFGPGDRLWGLVAERAGRLVGYALCYPVFSSFRARWRLWLEDIYVEPEGARLGGARLEPPGDRLLRAPRRAPGGDRLVALPARGRCDECDGGAAVRPSRLHHDVSPWAP
jgi:hypothetical protein